jgi:hypothetical protein
MLASTAILAPSGMLQQTGQTTYYQPMSGSMGSSESGFHPPAASFAMVKRSMAYMVTIRPINTPQVETCTADGYMSDAGARHQEIVHKPTDSTSDILKSQNGEKADILTDDWINTIVMTRGATGARFVNPENGRCYYRIVSIDTLLKKEAELQRKWETEHGRSWSDRLLIRLEPPTINCRRKDATPPMAKSNDRMFATTFEDFPDIQEVRGTELSASAFI